jgi:5-methylthioribose kinase
MDAVELDIENRAAAERYLVAEGHCAPGELTEHEVLAGGVSSRTVRVAFADGRVWVLKQSLAKLRVQADWFSDPRRVHREAQGMKVLAELAPAGSITPLMFDDDRHHVIGMEAVPQPHENWKTVLLRGDVNPLRVAEFGLLLGTIHRNSRNRRRELAQTFADRTFFETLRIEPYYEHGAAQEPRAAEFYRSLIEETRNRLESLVHGDFSPKNVLLRDGSLVLLDHEVIHWGDPAFDVGFATAHLLSKAHHCRPWRPEFSRMSELFWRSYRIAHEKSLAALESAVDWPSLEARSVRHTLGCLLARVVGRSPLEYLSFEERERQCEVVVQLIDDVPPTMPELIAQFVQEIERGTS